MTTGTGLNTDKTSAAAWSPAFSRTRGIDRVFGLQGGHIQPIWDHVARQGIRIVDVRHERAGRLHVAAQANMEAAAGHPSRRHPAAGDADLAHRPGP